MPLIINNKSYLLTLMPSPRVFISSTWYDLKYFRENLKFFVSSLGYTPILSESGNVFYDPKKHVHDACLSEVESCQMFVLIIGGHYGSKYKNTDKSITNREFKKAVESKIYIFSIVERPVYEDYKTWLANKDNTKIDKNNIIYHSVDSPKIFEFIEEVQSLSTGNALIPFDSFEDIESYLKQQWAGMMFQFITTENQVNRVDDTLTAISNMSNKIEFISRQIASVIIPEKTKASLKIKIMDIISKKLIFPLITLKKHWNISFTPESILRNETLIKFLENNDFKISVETVPMENGTTAYCLLPNAPIGNRILENIVKIGNDALKDGERTYKEIRETIIALLKENNMSMEDFLSEE